MANDNTVTVIGNVTRDPELRYLQTGTGLATFGIAYNTRKRDQNGNWTDGDPSFFDVTCWRDLADNVAESISKGDRVVVFGRLEQRSWETQEGEKRSKVEIVADEVAPSLKWATAQVTRVPRGNNSGGGGNFDNSPPRNEPPAYDDAEEPF